MKCAHPLKKGWKKFFKISINSPQQSKTRVKKVTRYCIWVFKQNNAELYARMAGENYCVFSIIILFSEGKHNFIKNIQSEWEQQKKTCQVSAIHFLQGWLYFHFFPTLICHFTPNRIEIVLSSYQIFFIRKFFFETLPLECFLHNYIVSIFFVDAFFPRRLEHLKMDTLKLWDHCSCPCFFLIRWKARFLIYRLQTTVEVF